MGKLEELQSFAEQQKFGLTAPLTHKQVESLARQWIPQIFFFEQEKFHPIDLRQKNSMIRALFDTLPENVKEAWRVKLFVRTGENTGAYQAFNPPVVRVPDDPIVQQPQDPNQPPIVLKVYRALNNGISFEEALEQTEADKYAVITHGASFERSDHFFGAQQTVLGGNVPTKGDPFRPRAEENGRPLMTVYASYKNLLETLKYELAVEAEGEDHPPDVLWGGFDIASWFFLGNTNADPLLPEVARQVLIELIAAYEANEPFDSALQQLPPGWELNQGVWDALTRYAFLEFEFFYAYNDFERVQDSFFDNEHEGDNEGCCLVFDRKLINLAAEADDPENPHFLLLVIPESIITSVHEEWQESDEFQRIPPPLSPPDDPEELKELVNLAIHVAWGSHATYLGSGDHPLADFQDIVDFTFDTIPLPLLLALPEYALALIFLVWLFEELFDDPQDKTSEDGIRSVPEGTVDDDPLTIETRTIVLPMTTGDHIYILSKYKELLSLRSFAGKWGAHDGFVDKSPKYEAKTGRYMRKLLKNL